MIFKDIKEYLITEFYILRLRLFYFKANEVERQQIKKGLATLADLKQETRHYKKIIHQNNKKIFYLNYICGFVFFDNGQMFQRGRLFEMFILWLRLNACVLWARLTGYTLNPYYLKSHFILYAGVKMASRKTGYPEETLLKPTSEILKERGEE